MQNVSTLLDLELVQGAAEIDVLDRFLRFSVKLLCPARFAPMRCLVEFLKDAKVRAGWGAYQQIGGFFPYPFPSQSRVVPALKVPTVGEIH